jgi:hypothetical protein
MSSEQDSYGLLNRGRSEILWLRIRWHKGRVSTSSMEMYVVRPKGASDMHTVRHLSQPVRLVCTHETEAVLWTDC